MHNYVDRVVVRNKADFQYIYMQSIKDLYATQSIVSEDCIAQRY